MKHYYSESPVTGKSSGVIGYVYDTNSITISFKSGEVYHYTVASCGFAHISKMKSLADKQSGLNTYLTRNKPPYDWKR